jgi:hypothetical protein
VAFVAPALLLANASDGTDKHAVAAISGLTLIGGGGAASTWRLASTRRRRAFAAWGWLTVAVCAGAYVAASQAWQQLLWVAGAGWAVTGMALFSWLEARDRTPFRPDASGWRNTALGLPVAALPMIALWTWRALGA